MAKIGVEIDVTANVGDAAGKIGNLETTLKSVGKAADQATLAGNSVKAREYGHLQHQVREQYREEMSISKQADTSYNKASTEADQAQKAAEAATKAAEQAAEKAEELAAKQVEAERKAAAATQAAEQARTAAIEVAEQARIAATEEAEDTRKTAAQKAAQAAEAEAARKEQAAQKAAEAAKKIAAAVEKAATRTTELALAAVAADEEAENKKIALKEAAAAKQNALDEQSSRIKQYVQDAYKQKAAIDQSDKGTDQEQRLKQEQQLRFMRGINRLLGQGPNVIGQAGGGNVAGAALGAAGGATDLLSSLPKEALIAGAVVGGLTALVAGANKLSEQWEKVMQPSMALTASLGRLSDDADKNHATFQEVFAQATSRKVLHGYKLEEGLALANQLSKLGVNSDKVVPAEERVFRYQRTTDADRNTLAKAVGLSERYRGGEDVLGYALGGLKESGMQPGQYQEYLNATLRIFEEGLSRGVVKGFAEITRAQNMLARLGTAWQGERGAERIQRLEGTISGAGKLRSDYDVVMYRAAQQMLKGEGKSDDYLAVTKLLDQGLGNGDILQYIHKIVEGMVGKDERGTVNRTGGVMQYMNMFGLNTEAAEQLWDGLIKGDLQKAKAIIDNPNSKAKAADNSPEGKLLSATEEIRKNIALWGSDITPLKAAIVDGFANLTTIMAGSKALQTYKASNLGILSNLGFSEEDLDNLNKLFIKTYNDSDIQYDDNNNGIGDPADNAVRAQKAMRMLSAEQQLRIGFDETAIKKIVSFFSSNSEADFTDTNINKLIEYLGGVQGYGDMEVGTLGLGKAFTAAIDKKDPYAMAYYKSVMDRYGSFGTFRESDEYKYASGLVERHQENLSVEKMIQEIITNSRKQKTNKQETEKVSLEEQIKAFRSAMDYEAAGSRENRAFESIMSEVMSGKHSQITPAKFKEITAPAQDPNNRDGMGGRVIIEELRQVAKLLLDLIPALRSANEFKFLLE
jgi:chromatin remodeling complex protein RSC6